MASPRSHFIRLLQRNRFLFRALARLIPIGNAPKRLSLNRILNEAIQGIVFKHL